MLAVAACGTSHTATHAAATHTAAAAAPASPAPVQVTLTCADMSAMQQAAADKTKQDALIKTIVAGGESPSEAAQIAFGAWIGPGTYANDLTAAVAQEENWADANTPENDHPFGSVDPSWPSEPVPLSQDMHNFNTTASPFANDQPGDTSSAQFDPQTWADFSDVVTAIQEDCGW